MQNRVCDEAFQHERWRILSCLLTRAVNMDEERSL